MDIRNWSMGMISQLPECVFGKKWIIGFNLEVADANAHFVISSSALPEKCCIWTIAMAITGGGNTSMDMGLALGDQLPTTEAQFKALQLVFPGMETVDSGIGHFYITLRPLTELSNLKFPLEVSGRRFVMRAIRVVGTPNRITCRLTVSSIPTEVPNWLISR